MDFLATNVIFPVLAAAMVGILGWVAKWGTEKLKIDSMYPVIMDTLDSAVEMMVEKMASRIKEYGLVPEIKNELINKVVNHLDKNVPKYLNKLGFDRDQIYDLAKTQIELYLQRLKILD